MYASLLHPFLLSSFSFFPSFFIEKRRGWGGGGVGSKLPLDPNMPNPFFVMDLNGENTVSPTLAALMAPLFGDPKTNVSAQFFILMLLDLCVFPGVGAVFFIILAVPGAPVRAGLIRPRVTLCSGAR